MRWLEKLTNPRENQTESFKCFTNMMQEILKKNAIKSTAKYTQKQMKT